MNFPLETFLKFSWSFLDKNDKVKCFCALSTNSNMIAMPLHGTWGSVPNQDKADQVFTLSDPFIK